MAALFEIVINLFSHFNVALPTVTDANCRFKMMRGNRLKALYQSRAIVYAGADVYNIQQREAWLEKLVGYGIQAHAA